jgi:AcrR family transcriptional regulator
MTYIQTLLRLQQTLHLNQRELAELLGCSSRTIIRHYKSRSGIFLASHYQMLAKAVHPHDRAFAAELAAGAGHTLVSLGLEAPPSPAAVRAAPSPRYMVDSVVCAAAEAMQTSPHLMRLALTAAFQRTVALGLTADDVLKGMAPEPLPKAAVKGKAASP